MSIQLYDQLLLKPLKISEIWPSKRIGNRVVIILKFRKVIVVFVDMCPRRTLRDVRYTENGKF
jgi:hypothetical protein